MAPTKKPRVNKRYAGISWYSPVKDVGNPSKSKQRALVSVSPEKDGGNSNKPSQRKKKLSDKLGPQWSKEELERFYDAYRKYGKDWKKVAAVVRNRSVEMVDALYSMNRAYLSLPEGTASVIGLIAMMTDHYNVLESSDSEQESNDASGLSRRPQKRKRGRDQVSVSKDVFKSYSSADGCLSLLKRKRSDDGLTTKGKNALQFKKSGLIACLNEAKPQMRLKVYASNEKGVSLIGGHQNVDSNP